jgi:hypothetical protein
MIHSMQATSGGRAGELNVRVRDRFPSGNPGKVLKMKIVFDKTRRTMKTIFNFEEIVGRTDLDLSSHRTLWAQTNEKDSNAD